MTFKKGDKVKANHYAGVWTVSMIEGGDAWCKNGDGGHLTFALSMLKKVPDFFEAGKTYTSGETNFDCHYVGRTGDMINGRKYAVGQVSWSGNYEAVVIRPNAFDDWMEI